MPTRTQVAIRPFALELALLASMLDRSGRIEWVIGCIPRRLGSGERGTRDEGIVVIIDSASQGRM